MRRNNHFQNSEDSEVLDLDLENQRKMSIRVINNIDADLENSQEHDIENSEDYDIENPRPRVNGDKKN
jgi:hypothetical protein